MNKKKAANFLTGLIIVLMLVVAVLVILKVRGIPKLNLDPGREERKEKREATQENLMGEWVAPDDEDFVIDIWRDEKGMFRAIVNQTDEEGTVLYWEMSGVWNDSMGGFSYTKGTKKQVTYDIDGNATQEVIYTDGTGKFTGDGEGLKWKDDKEKVASKITFTYSGEY